MVGTAARINGVGGGWWRQWVAANAVAELVGLGGAALWWTLLMLRVEPQLAGALGQPASLLLTQGLPAVYMTIKLDMDSRGAKGKRRTEPLVGTCACMGSV